MFDVANQGDRVISVTLDDHPIHQPCGTRDLWRHKDVGTVSERLTFRVGPRGCAVFRLVAAKVPEP